MEYLKSEDKNKRAKQEQEKVKRLEAELEKKTKEEAKADKELKKLLKEMDGLKVRLLSDCNGLNFRTKVSSEK